MHSTTGTRGRGGGPKPVDIVVQPVHRRMRDIGPFRESGGTRDLSAQRIAEATNRARTNHVLEQRLAVVVVALEHKIDDRADRQKAVHVHEVAVDVGVSRDGHLLVESWFDLVDNDHGRAEPQSEYKNL